MNPFLLSPMSGLQSYLHFSSPGGGHKNRRTSNFVLSHFVPMVGPEMKGT